MKQLQHRVELRTSGRGLFDLTAEAASTVARAQIRAGLLVAFCAHTSASLCVQENSDSAVKRDLLRWLERLAPDGDARYEHDDEGPDDLPAHLRSVLTGASVSIPIVGGALALGTWQALYLIEHRTRPHTRVVVLHVIGE